MINVNDINFALGGREQEERERENMSEYWHQQWWNKDNSDLNYFRSNLCSKAQVQKSVAIGTQDSSLISLFVQQSIEIFGSTVAPWPTTTRSISSAESGIFIKSIEYSNMMEQDDTSEDICDDTNATAETESVQSQQPSASNLGNNQAEQPQQQQSYQAPQSFEPKQQSKLRRSTSSIRKPSLSRINAELAQEAKLIYENLQPIPIITSPAKSVRSSHTSSPRDSNPDSSCSSPKERRSNSSRLQTFLSIFYKNIGQSQKMKFLEEESSVDTSIKNNNNGAFPVKSILKSAKKPTIVQKTTFIPVDEVQELSTPTTTTTNPMTKVKKSIKLRFDNEVRVCETFHKEDYCRQSLEYVARQLTPSIALEIKKELNALKQEMEIHDESRHYTQFYVIK